LPRPGDARPDVSLGATVREHDNQTIRNHAAFIWSVADLLLGGYKKSEYGRMIMPRVVLRRLDCVLDRTRGQVLEVAEKYAGKSEQVLRPLLLQATGGAQFYNTSPLTMTRLLDDRSPPPGSRRSTARPGASCPATCGSSPATLARPCSGGVRRT
jgi:hypothetical protein